MLRLFLFLFFPALELYLLIKVGSMIGALNMVLWIIASAVFGIWYARAHSEYSMMQMRADLAQGRVPQNTLMDSVLISLGGLLLVLPGLITDAIGLLLLFPPTRRLLAKNAGLLFKNRMGGSSTTIIYTNSGGFGPGHGGFDPRGPVHDVNASPLQHEEEQGPRQATVIESTAIEIDTDKANGHKTDTNASSGPRQ